MFYKAFKCVSPVIYHNSGIPERRLDVDFLYLILNKLWIGVPAFFVISGYCIAATCDSASTRGKSFAWYMARRVRRIYPPYLVCITIIIALASCGLLAESDMIDSRSPGLTPMQWAGNLTLTETWRSHIGGDSLRLILSPAWTLCYEEQFYIVCGVALAIRGRHFFALMATISAAVVPLAFLQWSGRANFRGFFFDGYWLQFAAGVLVYYCCVYCNAARARLCTAFLLAGAIAFAVARMKLPPMGNDGVARNGFLTATAFAFGFAAVLIILKRWDAFIANSRLLLPLNVCGTMCYSLYLIHAPIICTIKGFADTATNTRIGMFEAVYTIFFCLLGGACFYRLIERRFLNPSPRGPQKPLIPAHTARA